ncbi:MAG: hypothetical protein JST62_12705 [Bacteroidetes bacterium]|nr:hypothetical protein [Bacteroidota bacterium]
MKKYFFLSALAVFSLSTIVSCERTTDVVQAQDNDTYSQMKDVTGTLNATNSYTISQNISILSTDVVLVYRNINSNTNGGKVWQLLPKTSYLSGGRELDYNFLFNTQKVEIFTEANFDQSTMTSTEKDTYLNNQTFRIVLVPASNKNANVDYNDYNAVVKYFNLKEPK